VKAAVVNAAGFRLRRKGHLDGVLPVLDVGRVGEAPIIVVGEAPRAIQ